MDSDVIIAWLRGHNPMAELIPSLLEEGNVLVWTPVSIAEIFAGARKGEEAQLENLFLVLEAVPLSTEMGKKAGDYLNAYSRSHGVELGDALIAAASYVSRIPLWTLNKKHYPMKDLSLFSPPRP